MIVEKLEKNKEDFPSNEEIIQKYLNRYKHSEQSVAARKSALNYFFLKESKIKSKKKKYFGYSGHIFEINKSDLIDYFDFLNQLKDISLSSKKFKWTILKSFLDFCMDYYDEKYDFIIKFPNRLVKWKPTHKEPNSNSDVFLTLEEIKEILDYLKPRNYTYYLIFRLFVESGPRKGELINIDYDKVDLEKRFFDTTGKRGRKAYYFSKDLREELKFFIEERKLLNTETKALFISTHLKRFSERAFNIFLKQILPKIGIKKNVSCQVFRRSLNALRFEMGCIDDTILSILLNQAVSGVNFNNYVKKSLDYKNFLIYYDTWYPFKNIQI